MGSLFTIITPVYNKEKTLAKCIESVLLQEFLDWELLLIDDGSTDDSFIISNEFAQSNIKILHHDNHGVSYTRNRGIKEATGEYIVFLDADDYLSPNYLKSIADALLKRKSDVYITGITKVAVNGENTEFLLPYEGVKLKSDIIPEFYHLQRETQLYGYVPNKIIKREFYLNNNLFFDEHIRLAEDLELFLRCYQKADTFCFVPECGYYYIIYNGGTSMFSGNADYFSLISIQQQLADFCKGYMTEEDTRYYNDNLRGLATACITETPPSKVNEIPAKVAKLKALDLWQQTRLSNCLPWLMLKVFTYRLKVQLAQKILKYV